MNRRILALSAILAVAASSCTENAPPAAQEHEKLPQKPPEAKASAQQQQQQPPHMQTSGATTAQPNAATAQNNKSNNNPNSGAPLPPKDARFTLFCETIGGPDHVQQANYLKSQLLKGTTLKDWYVVHGEQESTLYYGYYRAYNDPKDSKESNRAQSDRKQIHAIRTTADDEPFRLAIFVELASPDPSAPAEWNLATLKVNENDDAHYWSLEIAAYTDSAQRKQAAIDTVKAARAQGVEAYYYHGESVSSVLVGCWPKSAIKEQDWDGSSATTDQGPIMILPWTLPKDINTNDVRTPEGDRIKIMAPKVEPIDPTLMEAMRRYPEHSVNGEVMMRKGRNPKTGAEKQVPDGSFIIAIPVRGAAVAPAGMGSGTIVDSTGKPVGKPAGQPAPGILSRPSVTPGGKLKEIGE